MNKHKQDYLNTYKKEFIGFKPCPYKHYGESSILSYLDHESLLNICLTNKERYNN